MAMTEHVTFAIHGATGRITLDRPKALHALDRDMCVAMADKMLEWRDNPEVSAVLLDHADRTRGFCAGGDVALVRQSALEDGGEAGRAFFHAEYRLNHLLFNYLKPVIALLDGVTMGGGVGLSLPCRYRVATENTLFAMPEGAIGLFPDVGAGWYLPRLPGRIGVFLALTGARLDGAECLWAGLATHYVPAGALADAKSKIAASPERIGDILAGFAVPPPPARLERNAERIDRLFASDQLEEIIAALSADPSDWAAKELKAVTSKCPTTAKVALRQIAAGQSQPDFAAEMVSEYRLAARMITRHDFIEGVRAVLVDKTGDAKWQPSRPEDVTEEMLDALFAPLSQDEEWAPL